MGGAIVSLTKAAAMEDNEAVMGHPSILILILPFEDLDRDVELEHIIDPDPRPNNDPLAGESRDGSSRGEHGAEPKTGRRSGVRWTRGEKIDRLISDSTDSAAVSFVIEAVSMTGGVVDSDSVDSLPIAPSKSMVSDVDAFGVTMASLTKVASDDRVVKAGTASGVWNKPTSDLGPSSSSAVAVGNPAGNTGDKPVGGVWNISTGERG
jgi:hypothetical protein